MKSKACSTCKQTLPLESFHKNKGTKDGLNNVCKKCKSQYCKNKAAEYRARNKARYKTEAGQRTHRNCLYRNKYGVTIEDYEAMLEEQNGLCAICGKPESVVMNGKVINLAIDHDHTTGEIRSLLCRSCNHGLGNFYDSPQLLHQAIMYLAKHNITE